MVLGRGLAIEAAERRGKDGRVGERQEAGAGRNNTDRMSKEGD